VPLKLNCKQLKKHDGNLNGYRYAGLAAKLAEGLEPKLTVNK
jgi:hypothetical protein